MLEPMLDLAEKLQMPLQPECHAKGWVRSELKDVRHEIPECRRTIYAEDVHKARYEIDAAQIKFANLEAHEYVIAGPHA